MTSTSFSPHSALSVILTFVFIVITWCFLAVPAVTAFMLDSRHPGVKIKILHYCTLVSTVKYTKAEPLVKDTHIC